MGYIQYVLDEEGGVDPTDPLGNLVFTDDFGGKLSIDDTYIDVWLLAFLNSISTIDEGETVRVEVLEEPYFVTVIKKEGKLYFRKGLDEAVLVQGEVVASLKKVSYKLIKELSKYDGFEKNITLVNLKKVIEA